MNITPIDFKKLNQVKPSQVEDGSEFLTIDSTGVLVLGEMVKCETTGCKKFGAVNAMGVLSSTPIKTLKKYPFIYSSQLSEVGANECGEVLCSECYSKRETELN